MTALPAPSVALDDQLCFALYAASRAVTARYRPMLDAIGLTYPQYLVMMLLWEDDHQTVGQLGSRLALDSGTLSPLLKRLTAAGLVTRHRRVEDERSVSIALTDAGRALRDRRFAISEEMIGAIGFDTGEFDDLKAKLRLLTERVSGSRPPANGSHNRPGEAASCAVQRPAPRRGGDPMPTRTARTAWNGTLQEGSGQVELVQLQGRHLRGVLPQAGRRRRRRHDQPRGAHRRGALRLLRDAALRTRSARPAARRVASTSPPTSRSARTRRTAASSSPGSR